MCAERETAEVRALSAPDGGAHHSISCALTVTTHNASFPCLFPEGRMLLRLMPLVLLPNSPLDLTPHLSCPPQSLLQIFSVFDLASLKFTSSTSIPKTGCRRDLRLWGSLQTVPKISPLACLPLRRILSKATDTPVHRHSHRRMTHVGTVPHA